MSLEGTLWLLSNFSKAVKADRLAYEFFEKRLNIQKYRENLRKIVEDIPPKSDPQGTDRQSELEQENNKLCRLLVEAEIENAELTLVSLALDLKISLVAQRVQEPFPGFFAQVGITPDYGLFRQSQQKKENLIASSSKDDVLRNRRVEIGAVL